MRLLIRVAHLRHCQPSTHVCIVARHQLLLEHTPLLASNDQVRSLYYSWQHERVSIQLYMRKVSQFFDLLGQRRVLEEV